MVSQYKPENEFSIDLIKDSICSTHTPFTGKLFYVDEEKKSPENPYGIDFTKSPNSQPLKINSQKGYEDFQNTLLGSDEKKAYQLLNTLYLQEDFRELIYTLFHIKKKIRHCAFSLLCSKVKIDQKTAPFFKVFFKHSNPISVVLIPGGYQNNYIKFLERDFVRWLTAIEKATGHEEIWKNFSEEDISIANIAEAMQESNQSENEATSEITLDQSPEVSSALSWLASIPQESSTIISDQSSMKAEKIYRLRAKWLHSPSKLKTAHKFIARLIEKWDVQEESEFAKSFKMFFSGLTRPAKQIFFIFGAASNNDKVQSLSYLYITTIMPIISEDFFSSRQNAQNYVKALYQSTLFTKTESHNSNSAGINNHFDNLLTQLKEVEEIFIPGIKEQDPQWAIPVVVPTLKTKNISKIIYPNKASRFNKYHFEVSAPKLRFSSYEKDEGCSAHEINAISGLAIECFDEKATIAGKPLELSSFDLQYKMSFKASSKFDRRAHKKALKKVSTPKKQETTLADIFNTGADSKES